MKLHPSLFCLAIGIGCITAPAVFAHDGVGEVIRDSIELPLILPHVILGALADPRERVVVVERRRPEYRRYRREPAEWRRPARQYWGRR